MHADYTGYTADEDYFGGLNDTYNLKNSDVESCTEYFDIVPDGNLYTFDGTPIFAVRMRVKGVERIMEMYKNKYKFKADVLSYKINSNQYTLYSSDLRQMYLTQKEAVKYFFNFDSLKPNEMKGMIIVVANSDDRMIHAVPYIYGTVDGRKKVIFLDPFGEINCYSGCIVGAEFFYNNYQDIDCYCHGRTLQADHHSCGIIACDFLKNCLKNNAKLAKKIMKCVKMRTEVFDDANGLRTVVNVFETPNELVKFSQVSPKKAEEDVINGIFNGNEKENRHHWFMDHIRTLLYYRDPNPYDPTANVIVDDIENIEKKEINTAFLEKGHKYAELIMQEVGQVEGYNPKYWLSVIRGQNEKSSSVVRFIKTLRKLLK